MGKWKVRKNHANVYVTGLPSDITQVELHNHFKRAGIIINDQRTGKPQIKIYKDEKGNPKGDARVTYLKEESVGLSIQFLNDSLLRKNVKIKVQKAEFQMKGKKFIKKRKVEVNKIIKKSEDPNQKLSWASASINDHKKGGLRIVILKHMFHPSQAKSDANFYHDLKLEVGLECERSCGKIEKITVFNGNPEGVIAIKYIKPSSAEKCISIMDGRYFGGKKIKCNYFDGITNYKLGETEEEMHKRHENFAKWIESGGDKK